MYIYVVIFCCY